MEGIRDRARRMTAESVGDLARGAGMPLGGSPGGVTTVVRSAERVAEVEDSRGRGVTRPGGGEHAQARQGDGGGAEGGKRIEETERGGR